MIFNFLQDRLIIQSQKFFPKKLETLILNEKQLELHLSYKIQRHKNTG